LTVFDIGGDRPIYQGAVQRADRREFRRNQDGKIDALGACTHEYLRSVFLAVDSYDHMIRTVSTVIGGEDEMAANLQP